MKSFSAKANPRNRIMLELMAKSGRESEIVFIPQKIADRLRVNIQGKGIEPEQRIFPITYNAARVMVNKAGREINGLLIACADQ